MTPRDITRRVLLSGVGAAGGGALIGAGAAQAAPRVPLGGSTGYGTTRPASPPAIPTPISSAPVAGVKYYFRDFDEFIPETFSAGRTWGGQGVYSPSATDLMSTSFDVSPGAVVYDIEWYVYNASGSNAALLLRVFPTGSGQFLTVVADGSAPSTGAMAAVRVVAPTSSNGPFPHGTRLVAGCFTPTSGTLQINGVRLGLKNAPLSPVLLPHPVRIVDSRRTGGPLHSRSTRTVSLASHVPAGALGALVNLTALNTVGAGHLTAYAAGAPRPSTSSLYWYGRNQVVANEITTAISGSRKIALYTSSRTNFIVDLVGYLV